MSTEVANVGDDDATLGLEDVGSSDVVIPRLKIVHDEGVFKDNLSGGEFPKLTAVILGLVKQRIMWDDDVEDDERPMCKSPDFEHGFPNLDPQIVAAKRFPEAESNFNLDNFPPENGINGLVTLPCERCVFNKWDQGGRKVPRCAEQYTFPLVYTPDEGDSWFPAIITFQKTGVKPSRQYISAFAQSKKAMFTVVTEIGLDQLKRGSVKYCVPTFKRVGESDRNMWGTYGETLKSMRLFIRQPPRRFDEDDDGSPVAPSANVNTPAPTAAPPKDAPTTAPAAPAAPSGTPVPPTSPATATVAPTRSPAPTTVEDDDLPF